MKTLFKSLLVAILAVGITACSLDKIATDPTDDGEQIGYLQISNVAVNSDAETAVISGKPASITRAVTEASGDFYIEVINTKTTAVAWSGKYSALKNGSAPVAIPLEGKETYKVYAYQTEGKAPEAGVVTDEPYYTGVSETVEIQPNQSHTTSVTCTMANVKASVELSADLKTSFKLFEADADAEGNLNPKRLMTTVSVGAASQVFEASHTHDNPKYFPLEQSGDNTMNIALTGSYYTGRFEDVLSGNPDESLWKEVTMNKTLTVRAAQWHKISIDIDHNTAGNAEFKFTIESYTYDDEVTVDVVSLSTLLASEETMLDDEIDLTAPTLSIEGRQDLNFTVNASMIDPETGAWNTTAYLKLNVTPKNGTVERVWARLQNTTNSSLAAVMATKGFAEGVVNLFGPKDSEVDTYATVAEDGKKITTKVAGMDALYKYRGTHTFRFYTLDSEGGGSKGYAGDLVITVTTDSGNGPTIEWLRDMDGEEGLENVIDEVHNLVDNSNYSTEITITSDTGITGLFVKILADPLTANNNEALGLLGLSNEMDLMNPADLAMENGLRETGLLPKAEGKEANEDDEYRVFDPATGLRKKNDDGTDKLSPFYGANEVPFSVTTFTGKLWSFYGSSEGLAVFELTAEHAEGTTTKSVKFNIVK